MPRYIDSSLVFSFHLLSGDSLALRLVGAVLVLVLVLPANRSSAAPVVPVGEIQGFVWNDWDADGNWDQGEPPLANVLVSLADENDALIDCTHTNVNGAYGFGGLVAGQYTLAETDPEGYSSVTPNIVEIDLGDHGVRQDFGDELALGGCMAGVGGRLWHDANVDGEVGFSERAIERMSVRLYDSEKALRGLTVSNTTGRYAMTFLDPGRYYVILDPIAPMGYSARPLHWAVDLHCQPTLFDIGMQRRVETARCFDLAEDLVGPGSDDLAPDGIPDKSLMLWLGTDPEECYDIESVAVQVSDGTASREWDTDPTTNAGALAVMDPELGMLLNPGVSFNRAITKPVSYQLFLSDPDATSLLEPGARVTVTVQAARQTPWQVAFDLDTCQVPTAPSTLAAGSDDSVVSGTVWGVEPADSEHAGEPQPLAGVQVTLMESDGSVVASQLSDAGGCYRFEGLKWRHYYLLQDRIADYQPVLSRYWGLAPTTQCHIVVDLENRPLPQAAQPPLYLPLLTVPIAEE